MADDRPFIALNVDMETGRIMNANNNYIAVAPRFFAESQLVLRLTCLTNQTGGTAFVFPGTATFDGYVSALFNETPLVSSADANWNLVADWASVDVALGLISVRLDLSAAALLTAMAELENKTMYFEATYTPSGGSAASICQFTVDMRNRIR